MKLGHIAIILAVLFLITACHKDEVFTPSAELSLQDSSVSVEGDSISSGFITAVIERKDKTDQETAFVLKFQNKESVYAVDSAGNRLEELSTKPLKGKNAMDMLQFKIFGKKGEAEKATYRLGIELMWNNQSLQTEEIKVSVK